MLVDSHRAPARRQRARLIAAARICAVTLLVVASGGCSDDDDTVEGATQNTGGNGATGGSDDAGGAGGPGSGGAGASDGGTGGSAGGTSKEYAAVIRGELAAADLAEAKAAHDEIAQAGEAAANAAGDIAHDALLGTTLLDSIENEYLAIDRWTDPAAMKAFYQDPQIEAAFAGLFAAPPTIEFFEHVPAWQSWGDMESGDAYDPYWFHFALGLLADSDLAAAQQAHDQVAAGGKQPSIEAGNVAHVVFLGVDEPRRFLAVDIWKTADTMQAFYTDPNFVAAFAPLFESVTQPVYQSTDWYQW